MRAGCSMPVSGTTTAFPTSTVHSAWRRCSGLKKSWPPAGRWRTGTGKLSRAIPGVETPQERPGEELSWFVFTARFRACRSREDLESLLAELRRRGIGCNNYFSPIHLQPFYRKLLGYSRGRVPDHRRGVAAKRSPAVPYTLEPGGSTVGGRADTGRARRCRKGNDG